MKNRQGVVLRAFRAKALDENKVNAAAMVEQWAQSATTDYCGLCFEPVAVSRRVRRGLQSRNAALPTQTSVQGSGTGKHD